MTTPNPQARALELLEIVSKATPGPWAVDESYGDEGGRFTTVEAESDTVLGEYGPSDDDADAIAALPDLATELRAALDRETAAVKEIQSLLECMRNMPKPPRRYVGDAHGCDL